MAREFRFDVSVGAGTAVMEPHVHHVRVGDTIQWVTAEGYMRVVVSPPQQKGLTFTGSGTTGGDGVIVGESSASSEGVMVEGRAVLPGDYYHTAIVWRGQQEPACAVGVVIIEPL